MYVILVFSAMKMLVMHKKGIIDGILYTKRNFQNSHAAD